MVAVMFYKLIKKIFFFDCQSDCLNFLCRFSNGTAIPNATIDVAGPNSLRYRKHTVRSTVNGDYFRLLLPGDYLVKVNVGDKYLEENVHISAGPATVLNFVVNDNAISPIHMELMQRDANPMLAEENEKKQKRPNNLMAAVIVIAIGSIACLLAGIVLYQQVKELRSIDKGGYAKIETDKFNNEP